MVHFQILAGASAGCWQSRRPVRARQAPRFLPLLHPMEERAGERRPVLVGFPSVLSPVLRRAQRMRRAWIGQRRLQQPAHLREGFCHSGFHGSFGQLQHGRDFPKFQIFVMTQHQHSSVRLRQPGQSLPHQFAAFSGEERVVGCCVRGSSRFQPGQLFGLSVVLRPLFPSAASAQFVVGEIERDPPQPSGKLGGWLILLSPGEHAGESFLREILPAMRVAGHAGAKALQGPLPAGDKLRKRPLVALRLDAPHRLLIGDAKERAQRGKSQAPHGFMAGRTDAPGRIRGMSADCGWPERRLQPAASQTVKDRHLANAPEALGSARMRPSCRSIQPLLLRSLQRYNVADGILDRKIGTIQFCACLALGVDSWHWQGFEIAIPQWTEETRKAIVEL